MRIPPLRKGAAADEAGAGEVDVEIAQHAAHVEPARPFLEVVEFVCRVAAADDGADRSADDYVRHDAVRRQGPYYANVCKAARCAAAQRQCDCWSRRCRLELRGGFSGSIAVACACE